MFTADQSRSATDQSAAVESLIAQLENVSDSSAGPSYNAKTYNQKTVTIENERILGLTVFSYEISLSERFNPKKHFQQFQQFSEGLWRDYALLMLTDETVALLDLDLKQIVTAVTVNGSVHEIHVESIHASLQGLGPLLERGKKILENFYKGNSEASSDLDRIVQLLETAHVGIIERTGKTGFFSVTTEDSSLRSELQLRKLDLSKASENLLEEIPTKELIYLDSEIPLKKAVRMDLTTAEEFVVIAKVHRKF